MLNRAGVGLGFFSPYFSPLQSGFLFFFLSWEEGNAAVRGRSLLQANLIYRGSAGSEGLHKQRLARAPSLGYSRASAKSC